MGFTSTVIGLAAVLKLQDDMSQPLDSAIKSAQRRFDELSVTAQRVEKIKAFDGLKAELDSLSAALAEAKRKRDFFVSSAETAGAEGVRQFGNDIRAAKQEVLELDRALNSKQAALREMGQSLRDTGIDTDNLGAALTRLDMEMTKEAGMKAFRARVDELGAKTVAVGKQIESIGLKIGAVGLAGQAGLSRAGLDLNTLVTGAVKAEDALYAIAITAGKSGAAARASVAAWSQQVSRVSVDTNKTQAEVIAALNDLIAKGMDPDAALRMLTPIGKAATGAAADIQSLASASNAAYQNMGVEAARALEIMSQSGKSGAFELRDMAGYFDLLTVKSQLLGSVGAGGLASLGAAAQIARKGAGDASTAANNLANFLDKLTAPVTAKAFDKFGVNLAEEVKKGLASGDLIGYMGALVQQMTQGDAAKLSALFSDVQTKNFIAPLIQNLDEYKRIRDEALAATGVVDQDFETAMQSSGAKLQAFQVQSAAAVNQGPALKGILDTLTGLSTWANDHPDLAKWLILGTAGAVAAGAVLGGIGATIAAVGGLTAALPSLVAGLTTVSAFLLANPIMLGILGVAAIGTGVYLFWDDITGAADKGMKYLKGVFSAAATWIKTTLAAWRKMGSDLIDGLIQGIKDKATAVVDSIRGLGGAAVREMKDLLGIRSPSKVFAVIGEQIGEGMVVGMTMKVDSVHDAAKKLGVSAIYGMKDALGAKWLQGQLQDYAALERDLAKDAAEITREAAKTAEQTAADGARLTNSLRTGFESAFDEMERYDQLLAAGAITWDTYGRAVAKATEGIAAAEQETSQAKQAFRDSKGRFLPADESRRAVAEWERASDDIQKSLTDALMRGFEGGKDWAENFRDTLKNLFNSLVLRPIIQPIAQYGAQTLMGMVGMGGATTASAAGGASGSGGLLSNATSAYNIYGSSALGWAANAGSAYLGGAGAAQSAALATQTGEFGAFGAASTNSALGYSAGTASSSGLYTTSQAGGMTLGGVGGGLAGAGIGYGLGSMIADGHGSPVVTAAGTAAGYAIGAQIGSIGGPLGAIIGGIIGGIANAAFGMGETEIESQGIAFSLSSNRANSAISYANMKQDGGWFRSDKNWTVEQALDSKAVQTINDALAGTGEAITALAAATGATEIRTSLGQFTASFRGAASDLDAWLATTAETMISQSVPALEAFARRGETVAATLQRMTAAALFLADTRKLIDDTILALQGQAPSAFQAALNNIDAITQQLADTRDIDTRIALDRQLAEAIHARYDLERTQLASLRDAVKQIGEAIKTATDGIGNLNGAINPTVTTWDDIIAAMNGVQDAVFPLYAQANTGSALLRGQAQASQLASSRFVGDSATGAYYNRETGEWVRASAGVSSLSGAQVNQASLDKAIREAFESMGMDGSAFKSDIGLIQEWKLSLNDVFGRLMGSTSTGRIQDYLGSVPTDPLKYGEAFSKWVGEFVTSATAAAGKIQTLADVTAEWYSTAEDAAKAMAESMRDMSATLRDTIAELRKTSMTDGQSLKAMQAEWSTLTVTTRTAEGDALLDAASRMAELAPELLESARDTMTTGAEYRVLAAQLASGLSVVANKADARSDPGEGLQYMAGSISEMLTSAAGEISTITQFVDSTINTYGKYLDAAEIATLTALKSQLTAVIPGHADGLARVPYDDYLMRAHVDETVMDARTISGLRRYGIPVHSTAPSGSSIDTAALIAEVRALRADNADLRAEVRAVVTHTARTARLLDRVMPDGDALAVRVEAAA